MPDMPFGDLTKNQHLPVVQQVSLTNRWLPELRESHRVRQVGCMAAPRKELTVSPPLRTVTAFIVRVQESHTCPRMTPSIFRRPRATRRGTRRAQSGPGCWSTARRSPTPRSPNAWRPVVTSRQPSSRHRTNAPTPVCSLRARELAEQLPRPARPLASPTTTVPGRGPAPGAPPHGLRVQRTCGLHDRIPRLRKSPYPHGVARFCLRSRPQKVRKNEVESHARFR